jgi:outer membrane biosynthesis protein TonB
MPDKHQKDLVEKFIVQNYSIVINPAIKTTYMNSERGMKYGLMYAMSVQNNDNIDNKGEIMDADELKKDILRSVKESVMASMNEVETAKQEELKCKKDKEIKQAEMQKQMEETAMRSVEEKAKAVIEARFSEADKAKVEAEKKKAEEEAKTKADKEADTETAQMKEKIKELEERLKEPSMGKAVARDIAVSNAPTAPAEMGDRELNMRFISMIQTMNGMKDTAHEALVSEGYERK